MQEKEKKTLFQFSAEKLRVYIHLRKSFNLFWIKLCADRRKIKRLHKKKFLKCKALERDGKDTAQKQVCIWLIGEIDTNKIREFELTEVCKLCVQCFAVIIFHHITSKNIV